MGSYTDRKITKISKELIEKEGESIVITYTKEEDENGKTKSKRKKVSGNKLPTNR